MTNAKHEREYFVGASHVRAPLGTRHWLEEVEIESFQDKVSVLSYLTEPEVKKSLLYQLIVFANRDQLREPGSSSNKELFYSLTTNFIHKIQ